MLKGPPGRRKTRWAIVQKSQKLVCLLAKTLQLSLNLCSKVTLLDHVRIDVNADIDVEDVSMLIKLECPLVMDVATDVDYQSTRIAEAERLRHRRREVLHNAVKLANLAEEDLASSAAAVVRVVVAFNEDHISGNLADRVFCRYLVFTHSGATVEASLDEVADMDDSVRLQLSSLVCLLDVDLSHALS